MKGSSRSQSPREIVAWVAVPAIVGASALALGGVYPGVLAAIGVLAALGAGAASWFGAPVVARRPATLLLCTGLGLTAYTFLQLVPLPMPLLAMVSPVAAHVWRTALVPFGEGAPWLASVSIDPTATLVEALKGCVYLATFLTAVRVARRREGVVFLERVLVGTALVLALSAAVHVAVGAERLFGLYRPQTANPRHLAPLLNPNHLAAYLDLGLVIAFAAALEARPSVERALLGGAAVFLAAMEVWIASRGGVTAMALGLLAVIVCRVGMRRRRGKVARGTGPAGVLILTLLGVAVGALSLFEDAVTELGSRDTTKLALFTQAVRMVRAFALTGVGRGAFEGGFPAFRTSAGFSTYTHPENVVLQWSIEWGVPVACIAAVAIAVALRFRSAWRRSVVPLGAWAALVTLALANLVDFSLETPAVAIAAAVCASIVVGGGRAETPAFAIERWGSAPRPAAIACVAIMLPLAVVVGLRAPFEVDIERRAAAALAAKGGLDDAALAQLHGAMQRHPGDPFFPFVGAHLAGQAGLQDAEVTTRWAVHALSRAPVHAPTHLVLARLFRRASRSDAIREYRIAMEQDRYRADEVVREAVPLVRSHEDALQLLPTSPSYAPIAVFVAADVRERLPATRHRLLRERVGSQERLLDEEATSALADALAGDAAPWCGETTCIAAGRAALGRLIAAHPRVCRYHSLRARVELAANGDPAAVDDLLAVSDDVEDRIQCLRDVVEMGIPARATVAVEEAIARLGRVHCGSDEQCASLYRFLSSIEGQRRNGRSALAYLRLAYEKTPDDAILVEIARRAASAGLHTEARRAYEQLAEAHPDDPRWRAALDQTRAAAALQESSALVRPDP